MPKHVETAELAIRIRFNDNPNVKTWYQRVADPDDQVIIWKTYPIGRYNGNIKWAAILPAADAKAGAKAEAHLYEYDTWPNGSTGWLSKAEVDQLKRDQQEYMASA